MPPGEYSEDALIEQPAIALFAELGYETANAFHETFGESGTLGRETSSDVVLVRRLRPVLEKLNPNLPVAALDAAVEEITSDRSALHPVGANREIYRMLRDGIKVAFRGDDEQEAFETVQVIDWEHPSNNDYFLASQFWISGDLYKRRADLVAFVNGLPLVFIELKASHKRLKDAYRRNLRDYKATIPQVFWHNAFIILSNGSLSRVGTISGDWEHFNEWKRINSEGEKGVVSLETVIRGMCDPAQLLDIIENFLLFSEGRGGLAKLLAMNHQYLGVNSAFESLQGMREKQGRLGVFWHTQGSGKSYSMILFCQKVLRKVPGNYTFVIVTDRTDLDDQIYKNFASVGAVTEQQVRAESGEDLKRLLKEDHRHVFTLIQKFHSPKGQVYPVVSSRDDIIVVTDEAHRSQYDVLALNMRNALPNAAFIGFTGTPLMAGEEKTRAVFGDYVSIYNFKQSVDDGATVPLYYENRTPELQLTNQELNQEMEQLLEAAELDEAQEKKLEHEFSREYHLITRDDRLETIGRDIVEHLMGRGQAGKAMVVSIDKATAVRMYDKVKTSWAAHLEILRKEAAKARGDERVELEASIRYMEETDMAVVVSQAQNEIEDFQKKGLDIVPHRKRMVKEDLDTKFKNPEDPFRIVFVCAMWMTGFDAPAVSTIYLDKPMRNHTLMQTIARANRVFGEKLNGLIVDYVGVFREMQKALAIYGSSSGGGVEEGETPITAKEELVAKLRETLREANRFCSDQKVDLAAIQLATGFDRVRLLDDAVDALLASDEIKTHFVALANAVSALYKAVLPDPAATEFEPMRSLLVVIADKIRSLAPETDISEVVEAVSELLDHSVAAEGYVIHEQGAEGGRLVDLSKIDFDALKSKFASGHKRIEAERLKGMVDAELRRMVRLNKTRVDYVEKFQQMIDEYNAGSLNVESFFQMLLEFAGSLNAEETRAIAENLSEEELALFDLLTKPAIELTKAEELQVKKVASELLGILKGQKLVLDWRKRQQTRAAVRLSIEEALDELPDAYTTETYKQKVDVVYQHVYDAYFGQGRSIYSSAGSAA